jgi:hypothetical protein
MARKSKSVASNNKTASPPPLDKESLDFQTRVSRLTPMLLVRADEVIE